MNENQELGQVFTDRKVADVMVSLISDNFSEDSNILDPCIGKNIFLSKISKFKTGKLVGVEVDKDLIDHDIEKFYNQEKRRLESQDFFDFNNGIFDFIIMNPPYVRQELLNELYNSKSKIAKTIPEAYPYFPKKSNLYIYFLAKALKHLKNNGQLVAIIYDSWLFTDFGESFKSYLLEKYNLCKIIHFRHGAFSNASVGATIILIENSKQKDTIEYATYSSPKEFNSDLSIKYEKISKEQLFRFQELKTSLIDFNSNLFTKMESISSKPILRGISAKVNKYFIFDENKFPPHTKKILKSVAKIKKFSANNDYDYILKIEGDISTSLHDYLEKVKLEILNSDKNKSMKDQINKNSEWYKINNEILGNIIFNYYMRDNIHFILNENNYLVADNFYNLQIDENKYVYLSILNSSITKYALLKYSKSQGHGLFKIQLNNFKKLPVLDYSKLSTEAQNKLEELGKDLSQRLRTDGKNIIREIDQLLLNEINSNMNTTINLENINHQMDEIRA